MVDMMEALRQALKNSEPPLNHNEAWSLACHKMSESNLARCYIELRDAARAFEEGLSSDCDGPLREKLRAIVRAND